MRVALYQPDIAQNTGAIFRLCACFAVPVDVIGPTGFDMSDKALKGAALDYLGFVDLTRHQSFSGFMSSRIGTPGRLVLMTTKAKTALTAFAFRQTDTLMFGRESAGCPDDVHDAADARVTIPMRNGMR